MIGTSVRGTLWYVEFSHQALLARPAEAAAPADAPPTTVRGEGYFISADPSGADIFEVTRSAVLNGKATTEHEFTVLHAKRCCEIKGRAIAAGGGAN